MAKKRKKRKKIAFKNLPKEIKIRKVITWIVSLVAILSLGYFTFYCLQATDTQQSYEHLSDLKDTNFTRQESPTFTVDNKPDEEAPNILEEYITLYNNNKSLIGWVKIDDTLIDYPVMQSQNADYYLNHNFNQEKDNNGSIFIDPGCSIWPKSANIILYGHNMKSGKMFGQLKKYKDKKFYENHKYIQFDTLYEKGTYEIMYVFNDIIYDTSDINFKYYQFIDADTEEEWFSAMSNMAEKSLYETEVWAGYGDKIITLSTCDYEKDADRFVVVAKKIK